jgi:hypothetical protein
LPKKINAPGGEIAGGGNPQEEAEDGEVFPPRIEPHLATQLRREVVRRAA